MGRRKSQNDWRVRRRLAEPRPVTVTEKHCPRCGTTKPACDFALDQTTGTGLRGWCRSCFAGYAKTYSRRRALARCGLTLEDYERILAEQGGGCAICGSSDPGRAGAGENFHVDHDHLTAGVRGLLCSNCNAALGLMGDDPDRLQAAIDYLRRLP